MWLYLITRRCAPALRLYWPTRLEGQVSRVPERGPLLVASNHVSFLDPWWIGLVFPRPLHYLINRAWYDRSALWRAFFDANGTLPVETDDPRATIDAVCRSLATGEAVGIFPEGGISRDGRLAKFRNGVARMAAKSGAPVVPLALVGAYELFPRGSRFPRPGRVSIRIGAPRVFPGAPRAEPPEIGELQRFTSDLRDDIVTLSGGEAAR